MADEVYTAAKRIRDITEIDLENENKHVIIHKDSDAIMSYSEKDGWEYWNLPIDKDESESGETDVQDVSKTVTMNRVVLRDPSSGQIYSSELPSYVDDMIFGSLTGEQGRMVFTTLDYENQPGISDTPQRRAQYISPLEMNDIPENVTFVDVSDAVRPVQYRFIKSRANDYTSDKLVRNGFVRMTMSDIHPAGRVVIDGDNELTIVKREVRAVKPQRVKLLPCDTAYNVSVANGNGIFIDANKYEFNTQEMTDDERSAPTLKSRETGAKSDVIQQLTNTAYRVDINLLAKPVTRSANLASLYLSLNGTVVSSAEVNMAMLSGDWQPVRLIGTVNYSNNVLYEENKELDIRLLVDSAEDEVTVKVTAGSIVELI